MGYQEYYLANEHQKMGHEVIVVTSDRYFPFPDYENTTFQILGQRIVGVGSFKEAGISVLRLPVLFEKSARVWLKGLKKTLRRLDADIIVSHGMFNFNSMRLAYISFPQKTKLIFDDHMTQNLVKAGILSNISYWLFRNLFKNTIEKKAFKIVGVYQNTVDLLVSKMGFNKSKVQWISMGSDTKKFYYDAEKRNQFRKQLGIEDENVIIYTGKINESKMVHLLVEALNDQAFDSIPKCLLIVGGVAETYKTLWEATLKAARFKVIYHAPVKGDELQNWFNASDIAAWPAHTTISSLDAAACGCAIICPDYVGERVGNNNGIAIQEGNLEELKKALLTMLTQPAVLEKMRMNSIAYIRSNLNWRALAEAFIK